MSIDQSETLMIQEIRTVVNDLSSIRISKTELLFIAHFIVETGIYIGTTYELFILWSFIWHFWHSLFIGHRREITLVIATNRIRRYVS